MQFAKIRALVRPSELTVSALHCPSRLYWLCYRTASESIDDVLITQKLEHDVETSWVARMKAENRSIKNKKTAPAEPFRVELLIIFITIRSTNNQRIFFMEDQFELPCKSTFGLNRESLVKMIES